MKTILKLQAVMILLCAPFIYSAQCHAQSSTKKEQLTLLFAGDIVLDGQAGKRIAEGGDPFVGVQKIFAQADLRIANLECVVATECDR